LLRLRLSAGIELLDRFHCFFEFLGRRFLGSRLSARLSLLSVAALPALPPADVELREVPEDWGPSVRRYRYYHTDAGVHFVDPESRRVIYDID